MKKLLRSIFPVVFLLGTVIIIHSCTKPTGHEKDSRGNVLYPSKNFRVAKRIDDFDCYGAICNAAHREDIAVHAWFVIFHEGAKDPMPIIKEHPEYLLINREGKSNVEQPTWSTVKPSVF